MYEYPGSEGCAALSGVLAAGREWGNAELPAGATTVCEDSSVAATDVVKSSGFEEVAVGAVPVDGHGCEGGWETAIHCWPALLVNDG